MSLEHSAEKGLPVCEPMYGSCALLPGHVGPHHGYDENVCALLNAAKSLVRRALNDPGAFVPRGADYDGNAYGERLDQWQTRAIDAALTRVFPSDKGGES